MATDPKTAGTVMLVGGSIIELIGLMVLLYGMGVFPEGTEPNTVVAGLGGFVFIAGNGAIIAGILARRSAS